VDDRRVANIVHALVERHRRLGRGAAPAVVDDAGSWTFAELSHASARAAGALRARGVRRGDRVAVVVPDGRRAVQALLGALRIGAIAVPLDPAASPERLRAVLADCAPAAVVTGALDGPPEPVADACPDDLACLVYTSGTTGRPKGVAHRHGALGAEAPSFLRDLACAGPGDRCHAAARTASALGFFIGLVRPLAAGATVVLSPAQPSARRALAVAEAHGVTILAAVPAIWLGVAAILERRPREAVRLASLRLGIASGDRLADGVAARLAAVAGPPLVDGLGSSECGDIVLASRPGAPGFARATPGVEVRVADGAGGPLPAGRPGLMWVRTPAAAVGYWRRDDLTRRLRMGPWLRSEDVVARRDGALHHLGRADELFKVDGHLVSPAEIERALAEDPRVAEAAVVAAAQAGGRVRPAAFVVPAAGAGPGDGLARELRRLVARRLAPALAPGRVVLTDALPRHASGKLDRARLLAAA
jgi:acyl-coenzyme A synthetase/AMP-(fatty) acid ligase